MTPQEARIKERIGLVRAINDLKAELAEAKAEAWDAAISWAVADEREAWYPTEGYEANPYR